MITSCSKFWDCSLDTNLLLGLAEFFYLIKEKEPIALNTSSLGVENEGGS